MFTISGRDIAIGGALPSLRDIAVGLASIRRWVGNTIVPFTVLQHSLMMAEGLSGERRNGTLAFYALWHDAHEFATGDIPPPFKTKEQRELQVRIQDWLYRDLLHMPGPTKLHEAQIKAYDNACCACEAHMLCHPRVRRRFAEPHDKEVDILWRLLDMPERDAVDMFLNMTAVYQARTD